MNALLTKPAWPQAAVLCVNCSDLIQQIWSDAEQALQYAKQLQEYALQLSQYKTQITNLLTLPTQIFSAVQADVGQVRAIINAASLLAGSSGTMMQKLQMGMGLANQASFLPYATNAQFTMWSQTLANAGLTLGNTLAQQQLQQSNYATLQADIQAQSAASIGALQAIQAGNSAISLSNTQLNQMQATLTAAYQEATTRDIIAANRQQMQDQQYVLFTAPPDLPLTGYPRY